MTGLKHAQAVGAPCSLINRAGSMSLSSGASSKDVRYISHAIHRRPSRQGLRLHKIQLFPLRYHHSPQRRRIADPFKHFCLYGDEQIDNASRPEIGTRTHIMPLPFEHRRIACSVTPSSARLVPGIGLCGSFCSRRTVHRTRYP